MRIVIVGGGIAAVYLANNLKKNNASLEVLIVSQEKYMPYDRIHLCSLINASKTLKDITLPLDPSVKIELGQKIIKIDRVEKRIFSPTSMFSYDKLIIATGSKPVELFDVENITNAVTFRSAKDAQYIGENIANKEVVLVGSGPISLELLETLSGIDKMSGITLLVRSAYLYSKYLSADAIKLIEQVYLKNKKIRISYEDEIIDTNTEENHITFLRTKKLKIENPFVIFGVGIRPNIEPFKDALQCNRGILTNRYMQSEDENIYAVGECAEVSEFGFVAGHVKECINEAECAIAHLLGENIREFSLEVNIDMLKVRGFELVDVNTSNFPKNYEKILITSPKEKRIDEYFIGKDDALKRFIGINSNIDVAYIQTLLQKGEKVDINYLYENRVMGERGRLVCSCEHMYEQDLVDMIIENAVNSFAELANFTQAGRVCGRCKVMVEDIIKDSQDLIDPHKVKKSPQELQREKQMQSVKKRIEKFNALHPRNNLTSENLEAAMDSLDIAKHEVNSWVSMVTADMQLHPSFEQLVSEAVCNLNKVPVIWLELSDCSGNSEAFIKSTNPAIEDLIFNYISLDYHELLMSASGKESESILEDIIKTQKGEYILIVEGAVPLAMDGKYLRIGGVTGIELLKKCAKDAALVLAVGSCAFDGGVVAAAPNPTGAVGVSEALSRSDIINISGCPTNPTNIVGTLLYYIMFEELPPLDKFNRPLWAYEGRIHDNCERRGHFELGEFVQEWGDSGAKKGWCLFEMGCKGPYANVNCPTMKFNSATSWPVQAGHGCMGCVELGFFDKYANERKVVEKRDE